MGSLAAPPPIKACPLKPGFRIFSFTLDPVTEGDNIFHQNALPWHGFCIPLRPGWAYYDLDEIYTIVGNTVRQQQVVILKALRIINANI